MPVFFFLTAYCLLPTAVHAQSVDILWQAETYTPPFYQGKALWSNQSVIKFVAIPQGFSNPSALNYKWTRNGTVLGNTSGVGKNSLRLSDSVLSRTQTIKVDIVNGEGVSLTSNSITLTPNAPILAVYEYSPLYGFLFHNEMIGSQKLRNQEVTLTAFPLFFTATSRLDPAVSYEWRTNAGNVQSKNSVTYRTPEGSEGSSRISVEAKNSALVMQVGNKSFLAQFGNDE